MKKSEKLKGKAAVADRKKQNIRYALAGGAVIIVLFIAAYFLFNPFVAKSGDTVMVYYTGTLENGTVFDSNLDRDPLIFRIGDNSVIPGFENAVIGMSVNSTKTVNIPVGEAYGPYQESLVHTVNRSTLPAEMVPEAGNFYTFKRKTDGAVARVLVTNVTGDMVTLDENHMLAGQNLTFTIQFIGFYTQ